jgi:mono/diheme cytochrome c family protein
MNRISRQGLASLSCIVILILASIGPSTGASEARLSLAIGGIARSYSAEELLRDPATVEIEVTRDATYGRAMRYRALPLSVLLRGLTLPPDQVIVAVASDGFIANLPLDLVMRKPEDTGSVPYLAIEPPGSPWPRIAGQAYTAGPFYIVWLRPEADGIRSEQWPYATVEIRAADSPAKRFPALAVDARLPATDPIRAGQQLYATFCLVCHRLNGAGDADVGPDLNLPQSPTEYFRLDALHAFIRNPSAVRQWKAAGMKGFDEQALSDHEIDLIIAYLGHMASRKMPAP